MPGQLCRMRRRAALLQIRRRGGEHQRRSRKPARGQRRVRQALRDADRDIVAAGDDIDARLGCVRVQHDARIAGQKLAVQLRQQPGAETRRHAEAQAPDRRVAQVLDREPRLFHHVEDAAVVCEQCFAGARETDAARAAIDERRAELVFQRGDALARLRARHVKCFAASLKLSVSAIRTNSSTSAMIMDLAPVALPLLRVLSRHPNAARAMNLNIYASGHSHALARLSLCSCNAYM